MTAPPSTTPSFATANARIAVLRQALEQRIPNAHGPSLDEFERRMQPQSVDELIEGSPSRVLAEALGLEHYEWLSHEYLSADFEDAPEDHPDVTEVT